jgi:hypothetical protein
MEAKVSRLRKKKDSLEAELESIIQSRMMKEEEYEQRKKKIISGKSG